jgi:hypothetical protein
MAPAMTSALLVATLEAFFFVILMALLLLGLVIVRAARLSRGWMPRADAAFPGFLLTVGLVPLFLLMFLGRPVVECTTDGGSSAIPIWAWFGSGGIPSSVSGSSSQSLENSVSTGTETVGATTYSWVCNGSTVTHFTTHQ